MQATNSYKAKTWDKFLIDSSKYIESCRYVDDRDRFSQIYCNRAEAFFYMNRPDEALDSANSGISVYYLNSECHWDKTMILLKLNQFEEAKNSLNNAERVANNELAGIDSYIIAARGDSVKEFYYKTRKSQLMRLLENIDTCKRKYFP